MISKQEEAKEKARADARNSSKKNQAVPAKPPTKISKYAHVQSRLLQGVDTRVLQRLERARDRLLSYANYLNTIENYSKLPGLQFDVISKIPTKVLTKAIPNQECAVCLLTYSEGQIVRNLPCRHFYHQACIDQWLEHKGSCPVCREPIIKKKQPTL
eukprot:TRINITY_DN4822_c0_g1_i2.p1 TRINITY_DN4822_c0_g1~~TRINITY_DN4822_c0_g1_i2.p1  ORF type:complete len:157 (+),score=25.50 TRINITY_DN4822_c0_g1_i2:33-503(+)